MDCTKCRIEEIESARLALGYKICLTCGEAAAREEANRRKGQTAIAYPKGGYQYITDKLDLENLG